MTSSFVETHFNYCKTCIILLCHETKITSLFSIHWFEICATSGITPKRNYFNSVFLPLKVKLKMLLCISNISFIDSWSQIVKQVFKKTYYLMLNQNFSICKNVVYLMRMCVTLIFEYARRFTLILLNWNLNILSLNSVSL